MSQVSKPVNNKKVLISIDILNRTINSSVDIPFDFQFFICATWSMHVVINTKHERATLWPTLPKTDGADLLLI